jgi:hypothetical protein
MMNSLPHFLAHVAAVESFGDAFDLVVDTKSTNH